MRMSKMFLPTLREVPSEAEVISHQLMLRAAMIRRLASGIYSYLPLGLRVIRKVEQIIREEMNAAGAQETLLPMVQPAEIWKESGRWEEYGKELLRFVDRSDHGFCLGPTHEEVITDLVRREVRSYRDLPLNLYQIQTKFRDEIRPRYGLMRAREFIMKDAYSFDVDDESAGVSYERMYEAYTRIFTRCGLTFRAVEADTGAIGGSFSHEFMVLAETGEDTIVSCSRCSYAANLEKAEARPCEDADRSDPSVFKEMKKVKTPGMRTIEDVTAFLGVKPSEVIKTLIFTTGDQHLAVLLRGDHEVNEAKLKARLKTQLLELAGPELIEEVTGAPVGFAGAVGLRIKILADWSVKPLVNAVMGANEKDYHVINVNRGRDYRVDEWADLRVVKEGDSCPRCAGSLVFTKGIEVGHVFKLGEKYSKTLKAVYLDASGRERFIVMGCYGIGVGRTAAAAIEQSHDRDGIIWPVPIAPFHVLVLPIDLKDGEIVRQSERLYEELTERGIETLLDDRDERPGIKFKDADLIGIPLRITVGPKHLKNGQVEVRLRRDGQTRLAPVATAAEEAAQWVQEQLKTTTMG
jgi:prolyl-tRNA synthetase